MEEVKLSNPPIKESIFIIRFRELLQQNQLEDFINSEYVSSTFDIQELSQIPKESLFEKLRKGLVTKADSSRVLKLNLDSFSYHRLRYVSFEDLYLEFESLWNIFREHASLPPVQSISLR
ncbi:MAG: TIGR04255 family protein, partial [Chitinophagaceae bacterium]